MGEVCCTRVDYRSGYTVFLYGKITDANIDSCITDKVSCEYYGFDNGMQAYFEFLPDSSICIIATMGTFRQMDTTQNKLKMCENLHKDFNGWRTSVYTGYCSNVVLVTSALTLEADRNIKNRSIVSVQYKD